MNGTDLVGQFNYQYQKLEASKLVVSYPLMMGLSKLYGNWNRGYTGVPTSIASFSDQSPFQLFQDCKIHHRHLIGSPESSNIKLLLGWTLTLTSGCSCPTPVYQFHHQ
jgi:hypothetical protein